MHGKSLLTIIILFWLLVVGKSKVYLVLDLVKTIVSLSPLLWDGSFLLITLDISYFGVEAEKLNQKIQFETMLPESFRKHFNHS